jgi:carbonic anhydrase/acetyltransferase-like protein (isoleucine patch superfamily)
MSLRPYLKTFPELAEEAYVDPDAVICGDVKIGARASVWPLVAARGDVNFIRIGEETNVQDGSILHVTRRSDKHPDGFPLLIGARVTVGHKAMLHGCILHDECFIGMGAIVMDGAVVETRVMLGGGALVPPGMRLESGFLYIGSPARKARALKPEEHEMIVKSAANYVRLAKEYQGN